MVVRQILKTVESTKETRDFHYRRRRLRKILKILLSPKLGPAVRPLQDSGRRLIHLIANVFAIYRLLPKNYPGLGNMEEPMSLKKVFADAWKNVKFTKEGLPQAILFFAIIGAIVFSVFALFVTVLGIFSSTAMAAPAYNQGTFDPIGPKDVAQDWLSYLFLGVKLPEHYPDMGQGIPQQMAYQGAFIAMLAYYSYAILIVAAIILFYILTAMLVETAHEGVPMGKNANQIWAPIRLVVAIGLLVPINGGLNSGQYIVVKMAQWGSGLASQTWKIFLDAMADYDYPALAPNSTIITKIATDLILMGACEYDYNARIKELGFAGGIIVRTPRTVILNHHPGTKTSFSANEVSGQDACGYYFLPDIPKGASDITRNAFKTQRDVFDKYRDSFLVLGSAKIREVMPSNVGEGTAGASVTVDATSLDLIAKYQTDLTDSMNALADQQKIQSKAAIEYIYPLGWAFAGTFLPAIERLQSSVNNAAAAGLPVTSAPTLNPAVLGTVKAASAAGTGVAIGVGMSIRNPLLGLGAAQFLGLDKGMYEADAGSKVLEDLGNFSILTSADWAQATADSLQCVGMLGLQDRANDSVVSGPVEAVLSIVEKVAQWLTLWSTEDGVPCQTGTPGAGVKTFRLGIQLVGPDIIQQMIAYGHHLIELALAMAFVGVVATAASGIVGAVGSVAGLATGWGAIVGPAIGGLAASAGSMLGLICLFLAFIFFTGGFTMAYVLPMYVFTRFFFAVISWIGGVIEAVVAIPLVSLAHLYPEGHGLPGGMAKHAYFYIFNVFLRPVLIIFGTVLGLLAFVISANFLTYAYSLAVANSGGTAYGHEIISKIIYTVLYIATMYICANNAFSLIDHLPDKALQWMGAHGQVMPQLGNAQEVAQVESAIGAFAGREVTGKLGEVGSAVGNTVAAPIKSGVETVKGQRAQSAAGVQHQQMLGAIQNSGGTPYDMGLDSIANYASQNHKSFEEVVLSNDPNDKKAIENAVGPNYDENVLIDDFNARFRPPRP